jgi:hypothetical protein
VVKIADSSEENADPTGKKGFSTDPLHRFQGSSDELLVEEAAGGDFPFRVRL